MTTFPIRYVPLPPVLEAYFHASHEAQLDAIEQTDFQRALVLCEQESALRRQWYASVESDAEPMVFVNCSSCGAEGIQVTSMALSGTDFVCQACTATPASRAEASIDLVGDQ